MQIKKAPVKDLVSPDWNPRQITTEELEKLKTSLEEFGYIEPIIVNDVNNHVVGGNQRLRALIALGYDEVDCVYVHIEDINKEKACNVALNKISGDWDEDKLRVVLEDIELSPIDIKLTGFDELELTELEVKEPITVHEDDFIIEDEEDIEVNVKEGDLFKLGNHFLLCGDSTNEADVSKLMNGTKAQMTFSDAPYNVGFQGSMSNTTRNGIMIKHKGANQRHEAIKNDKMNKGEFYNFMCCVLLNIKNNVKGAWYLSFSSVNLEELLLPLRDSGMDWKSIIVWMKNQATLSMKDYKSRYEPIVYGRFDDTFYGEKAKEEDIWEYQRTLKNDLHPTMKPIPLIVKMIEMSSKEGDSVLDLFGGSGSTLIACEQLNRNCYMMELDPYYCQVIINRWEEYTGRKAEKLPL